MDDETPEKNVMHVELSIPAIVSLLPADDPLYGVRVEAASDHHRRDPPGHGARGGANLGP